MKLTLKVYLAFVLDSRRKPRAGVLLATDAVAAMSKAVRHCKATYGQGSKVGRIQQIAEADLPLMERTQFLQVLNDFDKVAFVAVELEKLLRKSMELLKQLTAYVQAMQSKLGN